MDVKTELVERLSSLGKKYKYPVLILLVGLILLLMPSGKKDTDAPIPAELTAAESEDFCLEEFTRDTEKLLSALTGAGEVRLLLTLEADSVNTYLSDEERSQTGEELEVRAQTVLVKDGTGEAPVSVTRTFPVFRGALVLCQGGGDPKVTLAIKEAISSLTGLGMDKITVLKMD